MTESRPASRGVVLLAGLLFFLSGAAALAYELIWVKLLTYQFGSSAWSISTVVASFMAGLGAGSAWAGRRAERLRRPLRTYALIELGVLLLGLLSLPVLAQLDALIEPIYHALAGRPLAFGLARFGLVFAVLVAPTCLMGASLPVLVVGLAGESGFGRRVGVLYGLNTLGGAAGTLLAGVVALPALGIRGTLWATVALGAVVVVGALALDRGVASTGPEAPPPPPPAAAGSPRLLAGALCLVGGLGVIYQIAWTRLLLPVVGSSTYAFSIILTTVLVGIGLGGLLAATPWTPRRAHRAAIGGLIGVSSLSVVAGLMLIDRLPALFTDLARVAGQQTAWILAAQALIVGALVLIPTIASGAALPLAMAGWRASTGERGAAVGGIYAANTLGAIAGSLMAGFVLLPQRGADTTLRAAALLGLLAAIGLLAADPAVSRLRRATWSTLMAAGMAVLLVVVPPVDLQHLQRGAFRFLHRDADDSSVLRYVKDGLGATVSVYRGPDVTVLKVNGKSDASNGSDLQTQYLIAQLPLFLAERRASVAIVGYGSGATVHAVAGHPDVERIDVAELEPAVLEAAERYFTSINGHVHRDPRLRLHLEDGRTFLRYTRRRFDVIISEPSNPWIAGVSALFTREYYGMVRGRLAPGGVFCQWIQLYELSRETLDGMLSTLADAFPHVLCFYVPGDLICVASEQPLGRPLSEYRARMAQSAVAANTGRIRLRSPFELLMPLVAAFPEERARYASAVRNTDDNLWLEYRAPLEMYRGVRPTLSWIDGPGYWAQQRRLFPGVPPAQLARALAEGLARGRPRLWFLVADLARQRAGQPDGERLAALAVEARTRWEAIQRIPEQRQLARSLAATGRTAEARKHLIEILRLDPTDNRARRLLGDMAFRAGKLDDAIRWFAGAVQQQPDDYESHANLGSALMVAGQTAAGESHLARALQLQPTYLHAWRVRILHRVRMRQPETALVELERAERVLPADEFEALSREVDKHLEQLKRR